MRKICNGYKQIFLMDTQWVQVFNYSLVDETSTSIMVSNMWIRVIR